MRETIYDMWAHCINKALLCKFFLSKNKKTILEEKKYHGKAERFFGSQKIIVLA